MSSKVFMNSNRIELAIDNFIDINRDYIIELIEGNFITTHFQPIFSSSDGSVAGYEALARIEAKFNIHVGKLFERAIHTNLISILDVACREKAIERASFLGLTNTRALLFINVCPEALTDSTHRVGITDELAEEWGIPKERIVLEITESRAIHRYELLKKAIIYYKNRGYRIALDDFGAGYGSIGMFLSVEPDFVKIDRSLISNIEKSSTKLNIVDCAVSACHRMGIKVVAEGIERPEELNILLSMGVEFLQGYLLCKPLPELFIGNASIISRDKERINCLCSNGCETCLIGEISARVEPIPPYAGIMTAFYRFMNDPTLRSLPVVDGNRLVGLLQRNRFLECCILGKYGYGMHLNATKLVKDVMEPPSLVVEATTAIEEVSRKVQLRRSENIYDDVCVLNHGLYHGMVPIHVILDAITERSLILAKNANPLTGLPGNEFIQREISKRLSQNIHFDVCYIDINNFKPYNDYYGFEKGDMVIKALADILKDPEIADRIYFAGHIGGDDFIILTAPRLSSLVCHRIVSKFESMQLEFHGQEDYERGYYVAKNRRGEEETFSLLSLSIGIISTEIRRIESFSQLASIATEVKRAAKAQASLLKGSVIFRDRRAG
ncbi:MAG: EAL and GGDEF domain-containing protein [Syntrophobacterales bacterium]|nr:EAL and GGDEF domain-containing protein [Syntrophobacterales bacterium]